jgi:pre-rRNA-processing protein TSR1
LAKEQQLKLEGGKDRAPHFVTILSLDSELLSTEVLERLLHASDDASVTKSKRGAITYMNLPRFKSRYAFVCPNPDCLESLLDCLKVSDVFMILWPTDGEISEEQKTLLDIILTHGAATPMHLVAGLPPSGKQREQLRKAVTNSINKWISTKSGVFYFDSNTDMLQILRQLPTIRKKPGVNQTRRPHIYVEDLEVVDDNNGIGTLKLTGYVRGAPLNVNKVSIVFNRHIIYFFSLFTFKNGAVFKCLRLSV